MYSYMEWNYMSFLVLLFNSYYKTNQNKYENTLKLSVVSVVISWSLRKFGIK